MTTSATQQYSSKFCVLTKTEFLYFKSKEQFLNLLKPLLALELFKITEIDKFFPETNSKQKKLFHFYIKLIYYVSDNKNNYNDESSKLLFLNKRID